MAVLIFLELCRVATDTLAMDENDATSILLFAIANSLDVLLGAIKDSQEANAARVAMFQAANDLADVIQSRTRALAS